MGARKNGRARGPRATVLNFADFVKIFSTVTLLISFFQTLL